MQRSLCSGALNTLHSFLVTMSSVQEMSDVVPPPTNRFPPRPQKAMAGVTQARGYYTGPKFHPGQGWGHTLASTGHRGGSVTGEMGTHMSGTGGTCEYMSGTHGIVIRLEDMFALRPGQLGTGDHSLVVTR